MSHEVNVFYPLVRAGLPLIAHAVTMRLGDCSELERVHSLLLQALDEQAAASASTYYPAIRSAMRAIEDAYPEGKDPTIDAAYNVLHGLFWSEMPVPSHRRQMRTGQQGIVVKSAPVKTRAALADLELAYTHMQGATNEVVAAYARVKAAFMVETA